jgi:Rad3-related DNA helicase
MNEGLDLKDDLARYQIILKVPYLFMGDKRVAKRVNDYGEDKWYNLQAVETICQAYGRAQRNEEDWSRLYILDESFKNLWNRYKYYFTNEFKNSYMYGQYLISCENADILPKT